MVTKRVITFVKCELVYWVFNPYFNEFSKIFWVRTILSTIFASLQWKTLWLSYIKRFDITWYFNDQWYWVVIATYHCLMLIVLKILRLLIISLVYHLDLNILRCFRTAKAKKNKKNNYARVRGTWVLFFFFLLFFFRKARFKILWPWLLSVDLDIGQQQPLIYARQ